PGEEGLLEKGAAPSVTPAIDLAGSVGWSELGPEDGGVEQSAPGLGELRAHKPGDARDKERPLSLAHHKVTVRISGNVARTEIEESFQNDSPDTLEGIYRFPLPADARIDRLALDVHGQMVEGSFVESAKAAAIFRGVIHHAEPKEKKDPTLEMVWVPGPWRDPALLEWQR